MFFSKVLIGIGILVAHGFRETSKYFIRLVYLARTFFFNDTQHKVIQFLLEINKDYLHFLGCAILARKKTQSYMGLFYGCAFLETRRGDIGNTKAEWTVNGVNAKYFENHFKILHKNDIRRRRRRVLNSFLQILNPVALRGPTEIKCSVGRSSVKFQMNSEN